MIYCFIFTEIPIAKRRIGWCGNLATFGGRARASAYVVSLVHMKYYIIYFFMVSAAQPIAIHNDNYCDSVTLLPVERV